MNEDKNEKKTTGVNLDLLDVFRQLLSIRKKLLKAAVIGLIIGIIAGLSVPKKYTVNVTLSPEMSNDKGRGGMTDLAATFLGQNASISAGRDALNASLSSDIVSSTPFLLELLDIKVSDGNDAETLSTYLKSESLPWWSYIIGFPRMMVEAVLSLFSTDETIVEADNKKQGGAIRLTKEQSGQIGALKQKVVAAMDKKSYITSVCVTLQNPHVAALVADSAVCRLQEHIIDYRTSKAKDDCAYLEKLVDERRQEYYATQKKYAQYIDTHDNLILQSVRADQDRLQNDMSLAYQIYSQVANQLQVARAKVQEVKPVFAVVEPSVVPMKRSDSGLSLYAVFFSFLSVFCVSAWYLFGKQLLKSFRAELKR